MSVTFNAIPISAKKRRDRYPDQAVNSQSVPIFSWPGLQEMDNGLQRHVFILVPLEVQILNGKVPGIRVPKEWSSYLTGTRLGDEERRLIQHWLERQGKLASSYQRFMNFSSNRGNTSKNPKRIRAVIINPVLLL